MKLTAIVLTAVKRSDGMRIMINCKNCENLTENGGICQGVIGNLVILDCTEFYLIERLRDD
jgi:hypothetical protein